MQTYQHFIDGSAAAPASNDHFDTINPYTGEAWALIAKGNAEDVDRAVRGGARRVRRAGAR